MNQGCAYQNLVDRSHAGQTVLDFYYQQYRHSTAQEWQERIEGGQITLNGAATTPATRLYLGQKLCYQRPPWQEPDAPLGFEMLFEDEHCLVVAKPSGLPVLPGGNFLEHTLLTQLQKHYTKPLPVPMHRLGRGTSGLVLWARTSLARANLSQQIREHRLQKIYRALGKGCVVPDYFRIEQPIGKISHPTLGHLWVAKDDGLSALSEGWVLRRGEDSSLLEVRITTGRTHQIRIHLAAFGHPLVGDPLYEIGGGAKEEVMPGTGGYWLHAHRLGFAHPVTGRAIELIAPPPPELQSDGVAHLP